MDPDLDPTYPHPHHCHLVNPMANPFHAPLVLIPPLFEVDPSNPMQRTAVGHPPGPAQPQTSTNNTDTQSQPQSQSGAQAADRVAMESTQSHDPQTQSRLDARDQDARLATLAKEQFEMDRQEQMHKNKEEDKREAKAAADAPAHMFIRDVSVTWGEGGSGEAQRHAAQAKADQGNVHEWK